MSKEQTAARYEARIAILSAMITAGDKLENPHESGHWPFSVFEGQRTGMVNRLCDDREELRSMLTMLKARR